jgi:hypothetical protein
LLPLRPTIPQSVGGISFYPVFRNKQGMSLSMTHTETFQPTQAHKPGFIKRLWKMDTAFELCSAILIYSGIYVTTFLYTVFNTILRWKKL